MVNGLQNLFSKHDNVHSLIAGIDEGLKEQLVSGLTGSSRAMLVASIYEQTNKSILLVTHNLLQAQKFQEDLLNKIHETDAKGVVIDLTSVEMIDSFIAKVLGEVVDMSNLMGAKVVLTGIQPAVAITLIDLGIVLKDVPTALDLEQGLAKLEQDLEE